MKTQSPNPSDIFLNYLEGLNFGPGNRDEPGWNAFLRAASLNLNPDNAINLVAEQIRLSGGSISKSKLKSQCSRAYAHVGSDAGELKLMVTKPKPKFSPPIAEKVATLGKSNGEYEFLMKRSSFPPDEISSPQFLKYLYRADEKVLIFSKFESQGQYVFDVDQLEHSAIPAWGPDGVWFLSNPIDGESHPNPRQEGKKSRRSEESITSWRYLVLESDEVESAKWIKILCQLPLKIVAVYTSGGKSIHALVAVDAPSKSSWDNIRDRIKRVVVPLGADPNAMTAVRLTRLPGTLRGDKPQTLLYLNPNADGTPIEKLKERIKP